MIVVALALMVPLIHQVWGHNIHIRILHPGLELAPTTHEQKHKARPRSLRVAADLAWLLYMAGAIVLPALIPGLP